MLFKLQKPWLKKATLKKSPKLKEIEAFYSQSLAKYDATYRGVAWSRESTQAIRFMVFSLISDLNNQSVLDLGCGTGDYFEYLQQEGIDCDYLGLDLCANMVKKAREKHPGINVERGDIFNWEPKIQYDYVFGSGLLSYRVDDPYTYVEQAMKRLFSWSNQALALNFLSQYSPLSDQSKRFMYYDPAKILEIAQALSPFVELRHQYLINDFTVFIYKV